MATSHVHDPGAPGEVVGVDDGRRILPRHAGLMFVEDGRGVSRRVEVGEERLAVDVVEGGLARSDAVEEIAARLPPPRFPVEHRRSPQGGRGVAPQWVGERREGETSRIRLGEDAQAGESAEDPMERLRIDADCCGQVVSALRSRL